MSNRQLRNSQEPLENIWNSRLGTWNQCLCKKNSPTHSTAKAEQKCYKCGRFFHSACFWARQKDEVSECPFCFITSCWPQKEVLSIVLAAYLSRPKKQKNESFVAFPLSINPLDKNLSLEARCVKFNKKNRYELSWPDFGGLTLNKYKLCEFKPLQVNSPLKRRSDDPIKFDKNRLYKENQLVIEQRNISDPNYRSNDRQAVHMLMIAVVAELSKDELVRKLQKQTLSIDQSRHFLKENLNHEQLDSEGLSIEKLSISLKCQYYSSRIRKPVRSVLCSTHYQPFDLYNFISSSLAAKSSSRKWKCPICNQRAYNLEVDKYILELMQKNEKSMEICFTKDADPILTEANEAEEQQSALLEEENEHLINCEQPPPVCVIDVDSEPEGPGQSNQVASSQMPDNKTSKNTQIRNEDEDGSANCLSPLRRLRDINNEEQYSLGNPRKLKPTVPNPNETETLEPLAPHPHNQLIDLSDCNDQLENRSLSLTSRNTEDVLKQIRFQTHTQAAKKQGQSVSSQQVSPQGMQLETVPQYHQSEFCIQIKPTPLKFIVRPDVIEIDSDSEVQPGEDGSKYLEKEKKQKELLERLEQTHKSVNSEQENTMEITEEDQKIFDSLLSRLFGDPADC